MSSPRGIRNANPGNLEWGDPWQGLVAESLRTDPRFAQFTSTSYGIRALVRTLITYQDKHQLRTIAEIIRRWAPGGENDTQAYIAAVSRQTGIGPTVRLDMHRYDDVRAITEAIIRHENGPGPLNTPNTWYDDATIDRGLVLAGIEREPVAVGAVPVTGETVMASILALLGAAQALDATTLGMAAGIAIALGAVAVIVLQAKRRKAGTV